MASSTLLCSSEKLAVAEEVKGGVAIAKRPVRAVLRQSPRQIFVMWSLERLRETSIGALRASSVAFFGDSTSDSSAPATWLRLDGKQGNRGLVSIPGMPS